VRLISAALLSLFLLSPAVAYTPEMNPDSVLNPQTMQYEHPTKRRAFVQIKRPGKKVKEKKSLVKDVTRPARALQKAASRLALEAYVNVEAVKNGVSPYVAQRVIAVESGWKAHIRGAAGEYGLMQIKCETAREVGFRGACRELFDPYVNVQFGMRYLRKAMDCGGPRYYNAGIGRCRGPVPAMARQYERKVLGR